jgi:hypothetical protein
MALPKIDLPVYKVFLKSQGKEVSFRPFVVKEEKILLMALESGDFENIASAVRQVIGNCLLDDIDVTTLPLFEIEQLFLHIRARSMGEIINVSYICQNVVDEKKCGHAMELEVDLLKTVVESSSAINSIMLTDTVGIKLKYPTITASALMKDGDDEFTAYLNLIELCTEYLYDDAQVYSVKDMQEGEFKNFIENLTQEQYATIKTFFDDIPKIVYDADLTCGKCGKLHQIHLEGLSDFFD